MHDETTDDDLETTPPEPEPKASTVKLPRVFDLEPELVVPSSVAERYDLLYANQEGSIQEPRLFACALAVCWPYLRRRLQKGGKLYRGDVARYGGDAFELLIKGGTDLTGIMVWGKHALDLCAVDLPGLDVPRTRKEIEAAVGNSTDGAASTR